MSKILIPSLVCLYLTSQAQIADSRIVTGFTDSLYSKILRENRKVWIHLPDARSTNTDSMRRYPVIYAVDGGFLFNGLVSMTELLSGNSMCPDMIVVGITHTDRGRELTPTHVVNMAPYNATDTTFSKTSGGGEDLTAFLEKELIPYIETKYMASSDRMLIGHSTGGLMVVNTLIKHPDLFTTYVAIDPALWWDSQKLVKESKYVLKAATRYKGKALYVSIANTLPVGMSISEAEKDTSIKTLHFRSAMKFVKNVKNSPQNGLRFGWKYYEKDTHGSVPFIAEYDAIRFFFDSYKPSK